ncbi:N-acetyl-D-Glu racemase DgcA [Ahrensia sp. 13_GOM-1096m]|uniref:N-acetyl-D-Glu racemase DgcA n=1 Tax=Ahrensia sp. 13_GOM-1096m TaxID=1380380 RepID=UPI00047DBFE4|nr:N-acetyl-D-Glu racemase DgcA [Ahrensia sp. 13_GOM-1096m]
MLKIKIEKQSYPIRGEFRISRGAKTQAEVILCQIEQDGLIGSGECVPYSRYGENMDSVFDQISAIKHGDMNEVEAQVTSLKPGAARNALDCALWDWKAKSTGKTVADQICAMTPRPVETAFTLSLDTPGRMADAARAASHRAVIKIKLGGDNDIACMHAVTANAPSSRIIIDANEAWTSDIFAKMMREASRLKIALIEQPLPVDDDDILLDIPHPVPICADESIHTCEELGNLRGKYDFVNIKLDKTGGLTEALKLRDKARELGFGIMVGCMVGSSLAMAPAVLLAQDAEFVDLDGPLLLAKDRSPALHYFGSTVSPPTPSLWG